MKHQQIYPLDLSIYMNPQILIDAIADSVVQRLQANQCKQEQPTAPEVEEPISIDDACAFYKISRVTLYNWRKQGLVTVHGMGRRKYLYRSELMANLKEPKRYGDRSIRGRAGSQTANGKAA